MKRRALAGAGSCGEDSYAVAVMEKRLGEACAVNGDGGAAAVLAGAANGEGGAGKTKMQALGVAGELGRLEGVPRRGVACAVRALATRGRRRGHAARGV